MQRKVIIASAVSALGLTASGAYALTTATGGGPLAAPGAAGPAPSVVHERLYEDTFVVLSPSTTVAPAGAGGPRAARPAASTATTAGTSGSEAPPATTGSSPVGAARVSPTTTAPPPAGRSPKATTPPATTPADPPPTTGSTTPPAPSTTAAPAPTTTAAGQTRTYTSAGGSFVLQWTSRSLKVLSTSPAPGYTARVSGSGTEMAVVFHSSDRDIEITITLVGGQPRVTGL